ncbi:aminoglycoside phosphotransferase [Halogeometricum borinquense]|uniref:Aminoglycoside phosphotransferase n=1 Tax=Halogeometricum borinquense TaxID=60847 RepID=A0A6C0UKI5_9EURY|nr:aminoglycoside phosphotransferase [Halogeometricum borinquense]QIB75985.1 aminoglycoside phosphotransferase [Halogeometricum borinquense]
MSMNQTEDDNSGRSSLAWLRLGFQVLFAGAAAVLFIGVGAAPGEWGLILGVTMAVFFVYWVFREEIEQHLTRPQEWAVFAFSGVTVVVAALIEGGELTDGMLLALVALISVSGIFGYRAMKRR